jgi:hypothetical protein
MKLQVFFFVVLLLLTSVGSLHAQSAQEDKRLQQLDSLLTTREYAKVIELGNQILSSDADNFFVLTKMVQAGFNASQSGAKSLTASAIPLARRALELLDSGKIKDPSPFPSVSAARSFHNIALATMLLEGSPEEATALFLKLIRSEELKTEPTVYYYFGRGLLKGEYQKLTIEFKQKYDSKAETAEGKALLVRIDSVVEKIVDTYARAVALSTSPEQQTGRAEILSQLTPIYKALHNNSDAGLDELIQSVLSTPMPR